MALLIFRLNGVDDDEAAEVRQLLHRHDLPCYETSAGRWGLSVAAIWLIDESRATEARQLLDAYARERQQRVRQDRLARVDAGQQPRLGRSPWQALLILLAAAAILYLSLAPFLTLDR